LPDTIVNALLDSYNLPSIKKSYAVIVQTLDNSSSRRINGPLGDLVPPS